MILEIYKCMYKTSEFKELQLKKYDMLSILRFTDIEKYIESSISDESY